MRSRFLSIVTRRAARHGAPSAPSSRSFSSTTQPRGSASPMVVAGSPVNPFGMNQYAFACVSTEKAALVDCGSSTKAEFDAFVEWLNNGDYELTAVLQTHAHLDHVAGLGFFRKAYPEMPIYLHERERGLYESFDEAAKRWNFQPPSAPLPSSDVLTYFDDEEPESIAVGDLKLEIIPTPGHSPGHVGFYEPMSKSLFGGDLIMQGSVGRTDFPTSDPKEMDKSLRRVAQMDEDMIIYPGHGGATTLAQEKRSNPFLRGM